MVQKSHIPLRKYLQLSNSYSLKGFVPYFQAIEMIRKAIIVVFDVTKSCRMKNWTFLNRNSVTVNIFVKKKPKNPQLFPN